MPVSSLLPQSLPQPLPQSQRPQSQRPHLQRLRAQQNSEQPTLLSMSQSVNIRYELSDSASSIASQGAVFQGATLLSLYWEGRCLAGYRTIEQFYNDMATDGWQVQSIHRACSRRQLHFAVMKRDL